MVSVNFYFQVHQPIRLRKYSVFDIGSSHDYYNHKKNWEVMEKVASIIQRHLADRNVQNITLVGGAVAFPGFADVVTDVTGIPATVPSRPLFVTPIGIAMNHEV
jgi:Ethanolamine utilization protein EutJ (predicted chaperonin)